MHVVAVHIHSVHRHRRRYLQIFFRIGDKLFAAVRATEAIRFRFILRRWGIRARYAHATDRVTRGSGGGGLQNMKSAHTFMLFSSHLFYSFPKIITFLRAGHHFSGSYAYDFNPKPAGRNPFCIS